MPSTPTRRGGPQDRGAAEEWHVLQRSLPVTPASVRLARMTVRVACRAWRAPGLEEPAALVVSELVTTAVRHAGPGVLTLRVTMTPRRLRMEVHDPSGGVPDDVGTHGGESADALSVVSATAARWGVQRWRPGALLWAEVAL